MKIAVVGLPDFSTGKKNIVDERLSKLEEMIRPSKTTPITAEFADASKIKDADGIICERNSKLDVIINDLEIVEKRLLNITDEAERKLLGRAKEVLEKNMCLCEENFNADERRIFVNSSLVTIKPIYFIDKGQAKPDEKMMFDAYYGVGMICFFTGQKDKELKAWPVKKGAAALEAAGEIHSDIKRGFIKAEVVGYDDLLKAGNLIAAKQFMHLENKEYIVRDGDFIIFRFNV